MLLLYGFACSVFYYSIEVANVPNGAAAGPGSVVYCNVLGNLLILDAVANVVGTLPAHNIQTHTGPLCIYINIYIIRYLYSSSGSSGSGGIRSRRGSDGSIGVRITHNV